MNRVFTSLDDPEFNDLFRNFRLTAFRLETLQEYDVVYERNEFDRFRAGQARGEFPGIRAWIDDVVAPAVAADKKVGRVHIVELPLSLYVQFECSWAYDHTVRAGEDIRILPISGGTWPSDIPRGDFWLFDSELAVKMHYGEGGTFTSAEILDDASEVARVRRLRDITVERSVPYTDFAQR